VEENKMEKNELLELSEKISTIEKEILHMEGIYLEQKKNHEILILQAITDMEVVYQESKSKDLSSIEKRTFKAENIPSIRVNKEAMNTYRFDLEMKKINLRHQLRVFDLNLNNS
jgi:hypothetical protein